MQIVSKWLPMKPLRVLITHVSLDDRSGSALYVRDLALGLLRAGHLPIVFTTARGVIGAELRNATVPVIESLDGLAESPHIIVGNGHPELMCALMHFEDAPAIHVCHAWDHWITLPPSMKRIRRIAAVDATCRDWLVCEQGVQPDRVRVVQNAVDIDRFRPRGPLPEIPRKALVFSSYLNEDNGLRVLRRACAQAGIELDVIGAAVGKLHAQPESLLGNYDIVFAKARCALEALAVGTAVVLCNPEVAGPLVDPDNLEFLWARNFGRRALHRQLTEGYILEQISRYDPHKCEHVALRVRSEGNLDRFIERMVALCDEVVEEHRRSPSIDRGEEHAGIAAYIRKTAPLLSEYYKLAVAEHFARQENTRLVRECEELRQAMRGVEREHSLQGHEPRPSGALACGDRETSV